MKPIESSLPPISFIRTGAPKGKVEVYDPLTGIFASVARFQNEHQLFEAMPAIRTAVLDARDVRGVSDDDVRAAEHWIVRGWIPSLTYYLRTRRVAYSDLHSDKDAVEAYLRGYVEDGGWPSKFTWDGAETIFPDVAAADDLAKHLPGRRSVRGFSKEEPTLNRLGQVLGEGFALARAQGAKRIPEEDLLSMRTSLGLSWLIGIVVYGVQGVAPGTYGYDVATHTLRLQRAVKESDLRHRMERIFQGVSAPRTAAFTVVLFADVGAYSWLYRHEHALRRIFVESGVAMQYVNIAARSSGLEGFVTPAQKDSQILDLFGLTPGLFLPVHTFTGGANRRVPRYFFE